MHLKIKILPAVILLLITYTLPSFGNDGWNEPYNELITPSEAFLNENEVSLYKESFNDNFMGVFRAVRPENEKEEEEMPITLPIGSGEGILIMAVLTYLLLLYITGRKQKAERIADVLMFGDDATPSRESENYDLSSRT